MVLISDVFEEDGHRVFYTIFEYLVKLRYLGDAKAGKLARFVELMYLCVGSALFIFFVRHQEGLKVKVSVWNERHWKCFFAIALKLLIFFSGW